MILTLYIYVAISCGGENSTLDRDEKHPINFLTLCEWEHYIAQHLILYIEKRQWVMIMTSLVN